MFDLKSLRSWAPLTTKAFFSSLFTFSFFYAPMAHADVPDAATMLENLVANVPQFMQLVTATSYVMGMWLAYKGVLGLKAFGEQRSMMASHQELKGPLFSLGIGAALMYLPSSVQAGIATFWTGDNPYGYIPDSGSDEFSTLYSDATMLMELIGTVAFIRGLLVLHGLGGQAQGATFGKGITYIIAGVMCINFNSFLATINGTLGITGVITNN